MRCDLAFSRSLSLSHRIFQIRCLHGWILMPRGESFKNFSFGIVRHWAFLGSGNLCLVPWVQIQTPIILQRSERLHIFYFSPRWELCANRRHLFNYPAISLNIVSSLNVGPPAVRVTKTWAVHIKYYQPIKAEVGPKALVTCCIQRRAVLLLVPLS